MSIRSPRAAIRLSRAVGSLAVCVAAAACGGGGDDVQRAEPVATATGAVRVGAAQAVAAPGAVLLGGCVVDRRYIPATGTPVRALAPDGRLLGNARSDVHGHFALKLPAHSSLVLQVDRPQGESMAMKVTAVSTKRATCLIDELA